MANIWLITVYDKKSNIIDQFEVTDRTKGEAQRNSYKRINSNRNLDDWTIIGSDNEIYETLKESKFFK